MVAFGVGVVAPGGVVVAGAALVGGGIAVDGMQLLLPLQMAQLSMFWLRQQTPILSGR